MTKGLHDLQIVVRIPAEAQICLIRTAHIDSEANAASCSMNTGGSVLGDKQTGA
jgi:hypothetical protein